MTNRERRRILKEAAHEARVVAMDEARECQGKARTHERSALTGCQKRRQRKYRNHGHALMQSKKGYLRPYYQHEYAAIQRGER
jgi:hypothetical protein